MKKELILKEINRQNPHWDEKNSNLPDSNRYKRYLFNEIIAYLPYRQILSIVGLRRVGKTVLLNQIIDHLIKREKISRKNILFLSFDEALLSKAIKLENYLDGYFENFLENKKERIYIFLDEIQYAFQWQHILKRYYDANHNLKFIISGSSSLFLQKKSTESLAGRIYEFKLNTLSFPEYLDLIPANENLIKEYKDVIFDLKKFDLDGIAGKKIKIENFLARFGEEMAVLFEKFLSSGHFPEIVSEQNEEVVRKYIKESVYRKTIEFDIPKIFGIEKVDELKFLFEIFIHETGNALELQNIASEAEIDKKTLNKYLEYFQSSLLLNVAYNYTKSFRKSRRQLKKIYVASANFYFLEKNSDAVIRAQIIGHLAETHAYNLLNKSFEYLSFLRKRGKEIDFVATNNLLDQKSLKLIEVKYRENMDREKFDFIESVAKKKKIEKYVVFSKKQFAIEGKKVVLPLFLAY
ncbi:ATP-binding protein [Patescibacteria group bacterium]|nr:ATP-binding protein [Patescibacteria group bacterium]